MCMWINNFIVILSNIFVVLVVVDFLIIEAENAYLLKKRIIPLIFETDFTDHMAGWLGFIVRPRLYFRFDTDDLMEANFADLLGALGDSGRRVTASMTICFNVKVFSLVSLSWCLEYLLCARNR